MEDIKQFKIESNASLFNILRNKMYTNPLLSMVREIMCNARDANRESGDEKPIDISLPSTFHPYLIISDNGVGISSERMDIFTTYSATTKSSSDNQTGGFGLGAKTPFAYSNNFIIETIYNNIKYIYCAYINESENGALICLDKLNVNSISGTKIIIPIESKHLNVVSEYVEQVSRHWKIKPNIYFNNKLIDISYNISDLIFSYENIDIYQGNYNAKLFLLIDDIKYEFPFKDKIFKSCDIYISLSQKDIEIAANRDVVQINDFNINQVNVQLQKLTDYCNEQFTIISNKESFNEVIKDYYFYSKFINSLHLDNKITYKNNLLNDLINILKSSYYDIYYIKDKDCVSKQKHERRNSYEFLCLLNNSIIIDNIEHIHLDKRHVKKLNDVFNKNNEFKFIIIFNSVRSTEIIDVNLLQLISAKKIENIINKYKIKSLSEEYFIWNNNRFEKSSKKIFNLTNNKYIYDIQKNGIDYLTNHFLNYFDIKLFLIKQKDFNLDSFIIKNNLKRLSELNSILNSCQNDDFKYKQSYCSKYIEILNNNTFKSYFSLLKKSNNVDNILLNKFENIYEKYVEYKLFIDSKQIYFYDSKYDYNIGALAVEKAVTDSKNDLVCLQEFENTYPMLSLIEIDSYKYYGKRQYLIDYINLVNNVKV